MNDELAQVTVRDYVCAACYGHLTLFSDDTERWHIECLNCGGTQFVTKRWAERRKTESRTEKIEVDQLLDRLGIVSRQRKTVEQNLSELGF